MGSYLFYMEPSTLRPLLPVGSFQLRHKFDEVQQPFQRRNDITDRVSEIWIEDIDDKESTGATGDVGYY